MNYEIQIPLCECALDRKLSAPLLAVGVGHGRLRVVSPDDVWFGCVLAVEECVVLRKWESEREGVSC